MNYRIYVLDHRFQIMDGHDYEAHNDFLALEKADTLSATNPIEVWQRERLVARIRMRDAA
jgi:hypothetical protein